MKNPAPDGIPLYSQTARLPTDTAVARVDTFESVTLYLNLGSTTRDTSREIISLFDDALLAAICAAWGIHHPIDYVRANPIGALGPLADLTVTPEIIPPILARPRA